MLFRNTKRKPVTTMFVLTATPYETTTNTKRVLMQGANSTVTPAIDAMTTGQVAFANANPLSVVSGKSYNEVLAITTLTNIESVPLLNIFYKPAIINSYPFKNLKYFSAELNAKQKVVATFSRYVAPTNAVWTMVPSGETYLANTRYEIGVDTYGNYLDSNFGMQGQAFTGGATTPADMPSNTAVAIARSYVLNRIGQDLNLMGPLAYPRNYGYSPVLVIGYKTDVTAASNVVPTTSRTLFSALTANTAATIPVWNTKSGMKTASLSVEQVTALRAAATSISGGAPGINAAFVVIDTTIGDNITNPAYTVDSLIFLALDREESFIDFEPNTHIQIRNVGSAKGFSASGVTYKRVQSATEGTNTKALSLMYKNDFRQRLYRANVTEELRQDEASFNLPNPIDLTKKYCVLTIDNEDTGLSATDGLTSIEPTRLIFVAEDTAPSNSDLAIASPHMNKVKLAIDRWLSNNGLNPVIV